MKTEISFLRKKKYKKKHKQVDFIGVCIAFYWKISLKFSALIHLISDFPFFLNPAYGRQSISQTVWIVALIPKKNPASEATFAKKKQKKIVRRFFTLYEQKSYHLRQLISITFPQGFQKCKKFGYCISGNGGKKTFKRKTIKKNYVKNFFLLRQFYTLYEQKFSNLRPLLSITSLFYFSPRIANLQKVWTSDLSKLFINLFLVYL